MALTWGEIKLAIFRRSGDLERTGTATGGSTTTIVDTALIDATDTSIKGTNVYAYDGAGQSQATRATAFTAASDTITVPTQGTAFASGTKYILSRRFSEPDMREAIRAVLHARGPYAKRYVDQSLIAGSPLVNATFYDNSGTFPNGWTAGGTGTYTRESTISKHGRYSLKMVSTTTNASSQAQVIPNSGLYRGISVQLRGWLYTNDASRAYLQLGDGVTTQQDLVTSTNRGWGSAEFYTTPFTMSDRATTLTATLGIVAGAATSTAYFSGVYITGYDGREWDVPAGSPSSIHAIHIEDYVEGPFGLLLAHDAYDVTEETTRRLRVKARLTQGRILELQGRTGWTDLTAPTTDDDASFDGTDADAEGLISAAAVALLQTKGAGSPSDQARIANLETIAASHGFRNAAVKAPAGSLLLQR